MSRARKPRQAGRYQCLHYHPSRIDYPHLPCQLQGNSHSTVRATSSDRPVPKLFKAWQQYFPLMSLVTSLRVSVGVCSGRRCPSLTQDTGLCSGLLLVTWHVMVTESPSMTSVALTLIVSCGLSVGTEEQWGKGQGILGGSFHLGGSSLHICGSFVHPGNCHSPSLVSLLPFLLYHLASATTPSAVRE